MRLASYMHTHKRGNLLSDLHRQSLSVRAPVSRAFAAVLSGNAMRDRALCSLGHAIYVSAYRDGMIVCECAYRICCIPESALTSDVRIKLRYVGR